jgi:hypothetical protein
MIDVKQNEDGSFTIEWDSEDPYESIFNDWTEEDFTQMLLEYCEEILAKEGKSSIENSAESEEESTETVSTNETEEADSQEHNSGDDSISQE